MNVVILTAGSRGDVQPYAELGRGLRDAGYDVTLATDPAFEPFASEAGLGFASVRAGFVSLIETPQGRAALAGKGRMGLMRAVLPMLRQMMDDAWDAARDADAIVFHPKTLAGPHIAQRLDIPAWLAMPTPLYSPTRSFPVPALPVRSFGPFNRASYALVTRLATMPYQKLTNAFRREKLGLGPATMHRIMRERRIPKLYACSPALVPPPPDWDATTILTGAWNRAAESYTPPPELARFLDRGSPPVYVGFGSMAAQEPAALGRIVATALHQHGVRGIVATGRDGIRIDDAGDDLLVVDSVPHTWLFDRVAAVVHHGGAGTTDAGLRAGRPTIVCPFFGDQPFWGQRVAAIGAGPGPIGQKRLNADNLATALNAALNNPAIRDNAAAIGSQMRAEAGVAVAVTTIQQQVGVAAVTAA